MRKFKQLLAELFLTKKGWLSWLVANVITSLPWAIPLLIGFILQDNRFYVVAGSIWAFIILPITPFWILNVLIAVALRKSIFR